METCDVLIVGGGPAGSACAWKLRQAGLDVVVVDKARFPRDKVCAGWITPPAIDDLELDVDDYRRGRTFQPITGFRVGLIGREDTLETSYDHPVSFGIRRCEFDDYLLRRSGARTLVGAPVSTIRRDGATWILNDAISAPMLVGAGGHFCPVARMMNGDLDRLPLVVAHEVELRMDSPDDAVDEKPELYFCGDLAGYGWYFRKEKYVNIGIGRFSTHGLPKASREFVDFLKSKGRIPADASWRWSGHAYLLAGSPRRQPVADGVLLVGDSAGLAYPQSGEGIRPAIESGIIAASTIVEAGGRYTSDRLAPYRQRVHERFGVQPRAPILPRLVPGRLAAAVALRLLDKPWFVRHVVIDRWFLHAGEPALAAA